MTLEHKCRNMDMIHLVLTPSVGGHVKDSLVDGRNQAMAFFYAINRIGVGNCSASHNVSLIVKALQIDVEIGVMDGVKLLLS
jgi:hypothetical protein